MKIAAFQMDIAWESPAKNRRRVARWIESSAGDADLVVLPEMFSTGFSMHPERVAEEMSGETVQWLRRTAAETGKALICSMAVVSDDHFTGDVDNYYNRLFFVSPEGVLMCSDKRHLFRMGGEHGHYQAGRGRMILHYKGFRILPLVCYDLRFPVWSRSRGDYDLLVYVANWPASRSYAWSVLLRARAIENLSYVVGVNRCGEDPGLKYSGDSAILDFMGRPLAEAAEGTETMLTAALDLEALREFRAKFPAHLDADKFDIEI